MNFDRLTFTALIIGVSLIQAACTSTTTAEQGSDTTEAQIVEIAEQTDSTVVEAGQEVAAEKQTETQPKPVEAEENLLAGAEPIEIERDPDVPPLPFEDNADPALCGIPTPWTSDTPAYLSGIYEGELIQSTVLLYDSHLRRKVVAQAPHGAEVKILLSQSNPTLNYYLVKIVGAEQPNEGWIPAPFVSFEPPPQL